MLELNEAQLLLEGNPMIELLAAYYKYVGYTEPLEGRWVPSPGEENSGERGRGFEFREHEILYAVSGYVFYFRPIRPDESEFKYIICEKCHTVLLPNGAIMKRWGH